MKKQHETCTVPGCTRKHKARGYCAAHFQRHMRGVTVAVQLRERDATPPDQCTDESCSAPVKAKGLCQAHYARLLRHGHTRYPDRKKPAKPCSVEGCDDWMYAKGMCHRHYIRRRNMAGKYGTTPEAIDAMLVEQGGVCAVCRGVEEKADWRSGKSHDFSVDHDHATGAVRGLLCSNCNRGLGLFGDSPERLRAAAAYLERHRST